MMLALVVAAELMIADFNSGAKPNNLGGDFGAWIKDPADPSQGAVEAFDAKDRYGDKGYALRLIYSVASKQPAFGGLWLVRRLDEDQFEKAVLALAAVSAVPLLL